MPKEEKKNQLPPLSGRFPGRGFPPSAPLPFLVCRTCLFLEVPTLVPAHCLGWKSERKRTQGILREADFYFLTDAGDWFHLYKKGALVSSAETFSRKSFKREKKEKKERAILKADFLKLYLGLSGCNIAIRRRGSWFQHVSLVLSQSWVFSENTVRGAICKPGRELSPEPNHGWHPDLGFPVSRNELCMASLTMEDLVSTGENQTAHLDELAELGGASQRQSSFLELKNLTFVLVLPFVSKKTVEADFK
ncbi:uncharacterized protein LOC116626079 [Phoca vitulina]|uniref:uncharacterized protein LOC116626079 n=1 Tax=Phoca vitulina TaxID=9720 RepID=UPI0013962FD8|nr:uncharacterized protein LOC116626079 [Phoca vitulina]